MANFVSAAHTKAGRDAIGIEEPSSAAARTQAADLPRAGRAATQAARALRGADKAAKTGPAAKDPVKALKVPSDNDGHAGRGAPRAGSKQALIVGMLTRDVGATIDDLTKATGWLAHTTRAALTGLRKRGFAIERIAEKGQAGFYKIPFEGVPTVIIATGARAGR